MSDALKRKEKQSVQSRNQSSKMPGDCVVFFFMSILMMRSSKRIMKNARRKVGNSEASSNALYTSTSLSTGKPVVTVEQVQDENMLVLLRPTNL